MLSLKFGPGDAATLDYGGVSHDFLVVLADPLTAVIDFDGALFMLHRGRRADLPGTLSTVQYFRWTNGGVRFSFDLHPDCILARHDAIARERAAS